MAELPLNPPVLIMIIGLPGSGKTHFARQFAEQYELPYISENRIRYELFEKPSFTNDELQVIHNLSALMLENCLASKSTFVYETNYNKTKRQEITRLAARSGYKTLIVWIQADLQTALSRATKRDKRRPDDKYSHEITPEMFAKAERSFSPPDPREQFVVISGKFAYKNQQLAVVRKLVHIYGGDTLAANARPRHRPSDNRTI